MRELVATDEVKARLIDLGAIPVGSTPAQFTQLINNDRKRYAKIILERKITAN